MECEKEACAACAEVLVCTVCEFALVAEVEVCDVAEAAELLPGPPESAPPLNE